MKKTIIILSATVTFLFLILGLFSITISSSSAKYTNYQELNHYYSSNKLYLSSPNLDKTNKYNIINYYNYEPTKITINNSISSSKITNFDIKYKLTCNVIGEASNYYQCTFKDEDSSTIETTLLANYRCIEQPSYSQDECLKNQNTLTYSQSSNTHEFSIIKKSASAEQISTIETELLLTTTSPYSITLKGIYVFNIAQNNHNIINITPTKDTNNYCEYTINNKYLTDKTIKINFNPENIIIDETSEIYQNKIAETTNENNYINSITIIISGNSSLKIHFYKRKFGQSCNDSFVSYNELTS